MMKKTLLILGVLIFSATFFSCENKPAFLPVGFDDGGDGFSLITLTDGNGQPIVGATAWIEDTTTLRSQTPTAKSKNAPLAFTDGDGADCDDPLTAFTAADCSNSQGQVNLPCPPGTQIEVQVSLNDALIATFTVTCNGIPVDHEIEDLSVDGIAINVNNVPGADACENNLYAVIFSDFDTRTGENQVALTNQGSGTWSGILPVTVGATNVMVYIYCDQSTGGYSYDDDEGGSTSAVAYTNTAQFNACDRQLGLTDTYFNTTYTFYYFRSDYGYNGGSYWYGTYPSSWYDPYLLTSSNGSAQAGDIFATRIADEGDTVDLDLSALTGLSGSAHPDEGGTLQEWCNCILAADHYLSYYTDYTYTYGSTYLTSPYYTTSFYTTYTNYYYLFNNFFTAGFFTDTSRMSDSSGGSCVLP